MEKKQEKIQENKGKKEFIEKKNIIISHSVKLV
jgi:hypothetical protein